MGFCVLNNVAVAARYAQRRHGAERILIADWDVHHGNGTQATFYRDGSVLYFSTHQWPFYPGTGPAGETGEGEGAGTTINVPLPAGSGDTELLAAFTDRLRPAAEAFRPDLVLISAGFDARQGDLLGGLEVTDEGFDRLTRIVQEIAARHAGGRIVSVLEGGDTLAGLASAVATHLDVLMEG
jgi:acetoin utilization deacetylase AcuC-like enzyme